MSSDLFYHFLRSLASYETCTLDLEKKIRSRQSLHLACKDLYGKSVPELDSVSTLSILSNLDKVDNIYTYIPNVGTKAFQQHYIMFVEKVRLWEIYLSQMSIKPFMDPKDIIKRCISDRSKFADYLKDLLAFSIRSSIGIDYHTTNDNIKFLDINQIFPPKHLINFTRPKDISDLLDYVDKQPNIKNPREDLKPYLRKNILKNRCLREYDLYDHIDNMDEKGSFEKGKTTFQKLSSGRLSLELPDHLLFRINSIQKNPYESRTIAIAESNCKAFLSYTRSLYSPLLKCKYNYYGKDRWSFENKLHERLDTYHFLFDQKKCGWTFPMELIEDFFEILCELYPKPEFIRLKDIFSHKDVYYLYEGHNFSPKRGYTLGMFDDVCSYIVSCMFEMLYENIQINEYHQEIIIDGIFFGDDCDIISKTKDISLMKMICNKWLLLLDGYGITVNLNKSFYSPSGIFCEVYGKNNTTQMQKYLTYLLNGLDILCAHNTVHAKELFTSYYRMMKTYLEYIEKEYRPVFSMLLDDITSTIISSFPKEFLENEFQFPYEVGGWVQILNDGKNQLIKMCINKEIPLSLQRVSKVKKPPFKLVSKHSEKKHFDDLMDDEFWSTMNAVIAFDNNNQYSIEDKYYHSMSRTNITYKQYWLWQDERRKVFNHKINLKIPDSQIIFTYPWIKAELCDEMFELREDKFRQICSIKPDWAIYHEHNLIDQKRGKDIMRDPNLELGPYFGSSYPNLGVKDLYTSLDKNLAKCKYMIPTDWWELCNEWDISIEKMYTYLVEEGYDPFMYKPKGYRLTKKTNPLNTLFDLTKEIVMWCDNICMFISLTPDEALIIHQKPYPQVINNFLMEKIPKDSQLDLEEYLDTVKDRSTYDSYDLFEEGDKEFVLEEKYLVQIISKNYRTLEDIMREPVHIQEAHNVPEEEKFLEYKKSDKLKLISSFEDLEIDEEEPEEESEQEENNWTDINLGQENVLDYSQQFLANLENEGIDDEEDDDDPP